MAAEIEGRKKRGNAGYQVAKAIREGVLPKLDGSISCVDCGKPARDYEHRDYNYPLQVEPVCRGCNRRRGPGIPYKKPHPAAALMNVGQFKAAALLDVG